MFTERSTSRTRTSRSCSPVRETSVSSPSGSGGCWSRRRTGGELILYEPLRLDASARDRTAGTGPGSRSSSRCEPHRESPGGAQPLERPVCGRLRRDRGERLWSLAIGHDVATADIHETASDRGRCIPNRTVGRGAESRHRVRDWYVSSKESITKENSSERSLDV